MNEFNLPTTSYKVAKIECYRFLRSKCNFLVNYPELPRLKIFLDFIQIMVQFIPMMFAASKAADKAIGFKTERQELSIKDLRTNKSSYGG